jgi:glycosyltransferase involved in cell wall biosynthesis
MKILFIAPYRESTGWGEASRRILLEILEQIPNSVSRCIRLGTNAVDLPDEILKAEQETLDKVTHVIQCCLPHHMEYFPGVVNIGMPFIDSYSLNHPIWIEKLKTMDKLWVFQPLLQFEYSHELVSVPHKKINFEIPKIKIGPDGIYRFYFIGEFNRRKNIAGLVETYLATFFADEPVELVLKLNKHGLRPEQLANEVNKLIDTIKSNLRLNYYPRIQIITEYLSEPQLFALHNACDCFVTMSFAEAWCLPAQDAVMMNKPVIGSQHNSFEEECVYKFGNYCTGIHDTFPGLMNARDVWFEIPNLKFGQHMRRVFDGTAKLSESSAFYSNNYKVLLNESSY